MVATDLFEHSDRIGAAADSAQPSVRRRVDPDPSPGWSPGRPGNAPGTGVGSP